MDDDSGVPFAGPQGWRYRKASEGTSIDYFLYSDDPNPIVVEGVVDDESLSTWLTEDLTEQKSDHGGRPQAPVSGLKLVILNYYKNSESGFYELSCTEEAARKLHSHFNCSRGIFPDDIYQATCLAYNYSVLGDTSRRRVGFMVHLPTFWGGIAAILILYYDKDTCVTTALLITWENELGSKICENIKMVKADWSNPSILLLETLRHVSEIVTDSITERRASLQNINRMTGHFKYAGEDYVDALNANSIDLDFLSTSRALNECGQSAAKATACSFSLLRVLEQIQIFRSQTGNLPQKAKLEEEGCLIDERIRISTEEYEVLLLESQALEKQNSVLLQVFYQFMAQSDAKVNIDLAKSSATIATESKKDSSAMKTLSVLGMLFLPGAFVAAIFAMPVFDWADNGAPIMKPAFRYYWAVTLPLTLVVLIIWSLIMLLPWKKWIADWRISGSASLKESEVGSHSMASRSRASVHSSGA